LFKLGPQLSKSLKAYIERHVIFPTLEMLTSLLMLFQGDCPWHFHQFLSFDLMMIVIFRSKEPIRTLSLCSQRKKYYQVCILFSSNALTWRLPQIPPIRPSFLVFGVHFESSLKVPIITSNEGYKHANS